MAATKFQYEVGTCVEMSGVKDAVVVRHVKPGTKTRCAMYVVEYTVDDELERANPTGKRYQQPRYENEFNPISKG